MPKELNKSDSHKKPIVFDLYDTLLDESSVYRKFFLNIVKKYSLAMASEEIVDKFFQIQRKFVFANTQKSFKEITKLSYIKLIEQADPNDVKLLFDLYAEMDFFPGIIELLLELDKNHDLFILTNTDNDLLARINLSAKSPVKFKKIFTAENNGLYKPNKRAYQIVVDYIKLPANEIIYASSNLWDLNASKKFGFDSKTIEELKVLI